MKNIVLISLFTLLLSACAKKGGETSGGGGGTPTPVVCTTADVPNSFSVSGNKPSCVVVSCVAGYHVNSFNSACDLNTTDPGIPTGQVPSLFYGNNPWTVRMDINVQPQGPTVSNCSTASAATTCTFSRQGNVPFPSGLSLNASSGVITGTPSTVGSRNVTIRVTNSNGFTDTNLTINVIYPSPAGLMMSNLAPSKLYKVGQTISTIGISYSTQVGSVTSMTLDKALPAGLNLVQTDPVAKTWAITGTPSSSKAIETYTLTACGPTSPCTSMTFDIGTAVAPTSFSYNITGNPACSLSLGVPSCLFSKYQTFNEIPAVANGDSIQYEVVSGGEGVIPSAELPSGLIIKSSGAIYTTSYGPFENTNACTLGGSSGTCLYTIRAFNALGSVSTTIKIKITDANPPVGFAYSGSPFVFRVLTPFADISPEWQQNKLPDCSGQAGCYSVSPVLPEGLSLSALSGKISGSPFKAAIQAPATYTITANNSAGNGGSLSTTVSIEIKERLPVFNYNLGGKFIFGKNNDVISGGSPSIDQNPTFLCGDNAIPITSFSVTPALPSGLSLRTIPFACGVSPETTGGAIVGTPTVLAADTNYTIRGCNSGGCTDVVINIEIAPYIIKVVSGERHACAIVRDDLVDSNNGKVICWGANDQSQLGFTATDSCTDPLLGSVNCSRKAKYVQLAGSPIVGAIDLTAGKNHTCVILDSTAPDADPATPDNAGIPYCWGDNSNGQLGNGSVGNDSVSPVRMQRPVAPNDAALFSIASSIGAGGNSTCLAAEFYSTSLDAQQNYGQVYCTSSATGLATRKADPAETLSGEQILVADDMSIGDNFSCIIHQNVINTAEGPDIADSRGIKCWGDNSRGQLGDQQSSGTGIVNNPVFVRFGGSAISGASKLAAGGSHACYTTASSSRCWGDNTNGQLGVNTSNNFATQSVNVLSKTGSGSLGIVSSVGAINSASFFGLGSGGVDLLTAGKYVLSGAPYVGVQSLIPTNILKATGVNLVAMDDIAPQGSAAKDSACAASSTVGTILCWGKNYDSQLGNNSTVDSILPVKVQISY